MQQDVVEVSVEELEAAIGAGAIVLDVRTAEEVTEVRVPGVVHVPLDELADRLDDVPDADPLYVICRSGARSARACEFLIASGRQAVNVAGGTMAWVDSGRSVERDPG